MNRTLSGIALLLVVAPLAGCFDLDSFVWNARHCSTTSADSADCAGSNICSNCETEYDFASKGMESVERLTVPMADGVTLDAYFVDAAGGPVDDTIMYGHGNFGSIEHYLNRVERLFELGVNVFAIDYRGFGKSSTTDEPVDEALFMSDIRALRDALDPLLAERGLAPDRVFAYGQSAGALAAVEVAANAGRACGLILEAPFVSVQAFTDDSSFIGIPSSFITTGAWDNVAKIKNVTVPYLHLHGTEDATVRVELGQELFAAGNEPKQIVIVEGAEHGNGGNDVPTALGAEFDAIVGGFIAGQECAVAE